MAIVVNQRNRTQENVMSILICGVFMLNPSLNSKTIFSLYEVSICE